MTFHREQIHDVQQQLTETRSALTPARLGVREQKQELMEILAHQDRSMFQWFERKCTSVYPKEDKGRIGIEKHDRIQEKQQLIEIVEKEKRVN